jgi:ribonuclease-3
MTGGHPLEDVLGHRFADPELLRRALIHSSSPQAGRGAYSNERLEFLGDRVLSLVVADMLFHRFPDEEEGALARRHAFLVRRDALAQVAMALGLGCHIAMARGEEESGGRDNPTLLGDCCEAVIAALYLDGGIAAARRLIERHWEPLMHADPTPPKDAKTALQEWAQGRGLPLPAYREVGRTGPQHAPLFTVEVNVAEAGRAVASGPSKRAAETAAAARLLETLADSRGGT